MLHFFSKGLLLKQRVFPPFPKTQFDLFAFWFHDWNILILNKTKRILRWLKLFFSQKSDFKIYGSLIYFLQRHSSFNIKFQRQEKKTQRNITFFNVFELVTAYFNILIVWFVNIPSAYPNSHDVKMFAFTKEYTCTTCT